MHDFNATSDLKYIENVTAVCEDVLLNIVGEWMVWEIQKIQVIFGSF